MRSPRRGRLRIGMVCAVVGVAVIAGAAFYLLSAKSRSPTSVLLSVSIDPHPAGPRVPREFLGLSFELSSLPRIARYADRGDLVTMLRSLGPGVLRFGGVSADTRVAWTDPVTPPPSWASSTIDAGEFRSLRRLAARSGWRVLLTIGLAHYDPRVAAREAAAAKVALGSRLVGIEIGNEPDAYGQHGLRSAPWTFARYDREVAAYRQAINNAAPGLELVGPDVSGSRIFESWGRGAIREKPLLLTGHHYPLGCHSAPMPTIAQLLSQPIRQAESASLHRYLTVSRRGRIGFRLDETNTVSCGGKAGISNTFASALWAADYIAHAMAAGVVGINLQGNPANCMGYTPLCAATSRDLAEGILTAQPEWYALLLDRALVGDRPVRAIASPSKANIDVIALLSSRGELHVLIVDDDVPGARRASVVLHLGHRFGDATALSLTAPSPSAMTGIRLGSRAVERDHPQRTPARLEHLRKRAGTIAVEVPPGSATLITVCLAGVAGQSCVESV